MCHLLTPQEKPQEQDSLIAAEIKCDENLTVMELTYLQLQLYCHNITACNDQSCVCTGLNSSNLRGPALIRLAPWWIRDFLSLLLSELGSFVQLKLLEPQLKTCTLMVMLRCSGNIVYDLLSEKGTWAQECWEMSKNLCFKSSKTQPDVQPVHRLLPWTLELTSTSPLNGCHELPTSPMMPFVPFFFSKPVCCFDQKSPGNRNQR